MFFEPLATWSALAAGVARPWTTDDQIVFAPHIYVGSLTADRAVTGQEVVPLRQGFEQARREASVYGTTFWVGEWGFFGGDAEAAAYTKRFAELEDEFQVGSALWQWKQSCGDPHSASWPSGAVPDTSGNLVRVRCGDPDEPAEVEIGIVEGTARVLSRPYPRAFPGAATFTSDPDARRLVIDGDTPRPHRAPLTVWVPGAEPPAVSTVGLTDVDARQVAGGWIVTASPDARRWHLEADGAG